MASADSRSASLAAHKSHGVARPREAHLQPQWTLTLVDAGIAAALIAVPFFMGGRSPTGQLAFAVTAFWTSLWWTVHQALGHGDRTWRHTLAFWPMVVALLVVLLQITPISPALLKTLSPHISETLPLWSPDANGTHLGTWSTLSLTPDLTKQSLVMLLSGVLLFGVVVQRIQRVGDVERILRWLAISVSFMAIFGIAQFLTSNGKFFWTIENPYTDTDGCVKGAFTNRNHFAQFVALGFGALLWWVYGGSSARSKRKGARTHFGAAPRTTSLASSLKVLLIPVCVLAVLMSFSRGGTIALLVSGTAALFLLRNAGRLHRRTFAVLIASGLIACVGLSIYGYDMLSRRFEGASSLESFAGRQHLWTAACRGLHDHLLCGTGLSSHCSVNPMYLNPEGTDPGVVYTHAENGYVQIALETGLTGLLLTLVLIGFYFSWCAGTLRRDVDSRMALCFVGLLPPLLANAAHSTMDFVWYVPACMGTVVILAACACRLYQIQKAETASQIAPRQFPRFAWAGLALAIACIGTLFLPGEWRAVQADGPWNRYLLLNRSLAELNRSTPLNDFAVQSESRKQILSDMLLELSRVLEARPNWAQAHALKAELHRDLFHEFQSTSDNQFDLRMIRETVLDNFDSLEAAREWLPRGVGEHCAHLDKALEHAHRAVQGDPLQGETYLILAELSFLETSESPTRSQYIDQAFRVRPNDGWVLYEIGTEMTLAGRHNEAMKYFKRSFCRGRRNQDRLIRVLAGNLPAQLFLREFQPDADALSSMVTYYTQAGLDNELPIVLLAHAAACESKAQSADTDDPAKYWASAASSYGRLKDYARRRVCLQEAIAIESTNFDYRLALAQACMGVDDFAAAEKHARWCTQRKPGHPTAESLLDRAVEKRIASANKTVPGNQAALPSAHSWY